MSDDTIVRLPNCRIAKLSPTTRTALKQDTSVRKALLFGEKLPLMRRKQDHRNEKASHDLHAVLLKEALRDVDENDFRCAHLSEKIKLGFRRCEHPRQCADGVVLLCKREEYARLACEWLLATKGYGLRSVHQSREADSQSRALLRKMAPE